MVTPELTEDVVSFEAFLKAVEPKLKRLLATYRIPCEDAEDVLQQALLALLYQWDRVRDPESWLFGTVKRHCLMYWRMHRRRIYSAVDSTILEWLSEPIAPSQERSDLLADVESLIDRLPTRCRSLLRLRFRLGYEPLEVARKLGYQASSIGKITTRCLAALSRELLASGLAEALAKPAEARRAR
jgi:RNA polymerase sigma factor (sigma-70 family)